MASNHARAVILVSAMSVVAGARNHLQANYRSVAFSLGIQNPPFAGPIHCRGYETPGGHAEGWNASLAFSIEGVALAA
jgi:hypothetical protein